MTILSDEKQTHLAHVILQCLQNSPDATIVGDPALALREIKRVIAEQMKLEHDLDQKIRARLQSYSRPIPEGSQEWDILYQKTYAEEIRKRKLG